MIDPHPLVRIHRRFMICIAATAMLMLGGFALANGVGQVITVTDANAEPLRIVVGVKPIEVALKVALEGPADPMHVSLTARLLDFDRREVDRVTSDVMLQPGKALPVTLTLNPSDYGYYRLQVFADGRAADKQPLFEAGYGVLHDRVPFVKGTGPDLLGVVFHISQGQALTASIEALLYDGGFGWVRDDFSWNKVENEAGHYATPEDWRHTYERLRARGIQTLLILGYDSPFYKHATPEEAQAYGRYAAFAASDLKGLVDHFEIWNEPSGFAVLAPQQYPPVLKEGYAGVKSGNPQATVIAIGGAAPGGWSHHYFDEIIKQDALGSMDSFSIHPYTSPSPADLGYNTVGAAAPLANLDSGGTITGDFLAKIQSASGT